MLVREQKVTREFTRIDHYKVCLNFNCKFWLNLGYGYCLHTEAIRWSTRASYSH